MAAGGGGGSRAGLGGAGGGSAGGTSSNCTQWSGGPGLPNLGGLQDSLASGALSQGAGDKDGSAADPSSKLLELASGTHTLRVAADGDNKQKLSLIEKAAEYSVIRNGDDVWAYDSASNQAYHTTGAGDRLQ